MPSLPILFHTFAENFQINMMAESRGYMQHYAMLYGAYLGVFWIVGALFFPLGLGNPFLFLAFISFVLCGPFIAYRYVRAYRNSACGGYISFIHGWTFTVLMYMFAALLAAAAHYVYFRFIDQGYILNTYAALVDQFFTQGSSDAAGMVAYKEQIEMALDQLSMLTPIEITLQLFSNNVFWGVFLAIPTALFAMKRVPPLNQ